MKSIYHIARELYILNNISSLDSATCSLVTTVARDLSPVYTGTISLGLASGYHDRHG